MTDPTSNTNYTVMARRFRPQAFGEVVGQEHISQALRNAIRANRVAHAYLFTGARGVGKTSSARILAKALNCPNAVDGDPCNECEICQGISAGNDIDVSEIDGASNRGIEDIRQLRANVNVKSMRTKYKVYIIDEVHMLTKEAFNALLKTLEEPPPSVKFVFCTTEPNKVPDTILSRCQRFDFGTIATTNIKLRLAQIAEAEGVQVDDGALELVARRAAGSMRDSQSIFDQLLAFGEEHVGAADVHRLLGTASDDRLAAIVEALVNHDQPEVLNAFHLVLDGGVQLGEVTDQLLFYLRDLMVIATGANNIELLSVSESTRPMLIQQAQRWGLQTIVSAMQILADTKSRMQRVTYGRALAELALVRIAMLENLLSLDAVIEQLRTSESISPPPSSTTAAGQLEKKNDVISRAEPTPTARLAAREPATEVRSFPADTYREVPQTPERPSVLIQSPTVEIAQKVEPEPIRPASLPVSKPEISASEEPTKDQTPAAQTATLPSDELPVAAFQHGNPNEFWMQVVAEINDLLKSHAKSATRTAIIGPNKLEVSFPQRYHFSKKYCEKPDVLRRLEEIASRLAGQSLRITLSTAEDNSVTAGTATPETPKAVKSNRRVYKPEEDPFVSNIMSLFEAQVVKVEPLLVNSTGSDTTSRQEE